MYIFQSTELCYMGDIHLPYFVAVQPTGINPSMHSWNSMPLTAGTCRHYGLGLVSAKVELPDQTRRILVKELMAYLCLLEHIWQGGHRYRGRKSICSPVSLCDESR
ncbi:hypothetical protein HGM15179_000465 [Zosterops borbonicus]|uniref:Uncharacterized protein n=1 Tax=Zosterops borbonicus TaxID=364589 RepID=A0A8K1GZX6_9PASS|nr:hypothetical protein HGM15179_000465 [Zosterops borbonicus]